MKELLKDILQELKEHDADLKISIIELIDFFNEIQGSQDYENMIFKENLDNVIKKLKLIKHSQSLTISMIERS